MLPAAQPLSVAALALILVVATQARFWKLGRLSLWYDEVVTMRLARQPDPAALIRLLQEIDATRAPLHPILLQSWLALFGPDDWSGRAFSAVCGVATVWLVYLLGRDACDRRVGLWAAWLAVLSPALVRYAQEVRMYSWLVLVTCVAWWLLLRIRRGCGGGGLAAYALSLLALSYSHPLGLVMIATLVPVSVLVWRSAGRGGRSWWIVQASWIAALLPWIGHYLDHPPESVVGRLPLRFLVGMPIEFLGGDFRIMAVAWVTIAVGAVTIRGTWRPFRLVARLDVSETWWAWLAWFLVPPTLLYGYSWIGHPLFGPARYTLFVAPAYLLLVARGLARLPVVVGVLVAATFTAHSWGMLEGMVYDPQRKADWRAAAALLDRTYSGAVTVIVAVDDPAHNVEVETARYYLPRRFDVLRDRIDSYGTGLDEDQPIVFAVGTRQGTPVAAIPPAFQPDAGVLVQERWLSGLNLYLRGSVSGTVP